MVALCSTWTFNSLVGSSSPIMPRVLQSILYLPLPPEELGIDSPEVREIFLAKIYELGNPGASSEMEDDFLCEFWFCVLSPLAEGNLIIAHVKPSFSCWKGNQRLWGKTLLGQWNLNPQALTS